VITPVPLASIVNPMFVSFPVTDNLGLLPVELLVIVNSFTADAVEINLRNSLLLLSTIEKEPTLRFALKVGLVSDDKLIKSDATIFFKLLESLASVINKLSVGATVTNVFPIISELVIDVKKSLASTFLRFPESDVSLIKRKSPDTAVTVVLPVISVLVKV